MKLHKNDEPVANDPYADVNTDHSPQLDFEEPSETVPKQPETEDDTDLASAMLEMDRTAQITKQMRNQLLAVLTPAVMSADIDIKAKTLNSEAIEAQTKIISEYRALLNDMDSSSKANVSAKLKLEGIRSQNNAANVVAANILSQISNAILTKTGRTIDSDELKNADDEIDSRLSSEHMEILDTEKEMGGHMLPKSAPKDDFD